MKKMWSLLPVLFLASTPVLAIEGAFGCFSWARNYTDLKFVPDAQQKPLLLKLCQGAEDERPAVCYRDARATSNFDQAFLVELCAPKDCR